MKKTSLFRHLILFALTGALAHAAQADEPHTDKQAREPYRAVPPTRPEPRNPDEFAYGEYHNSSKMTPGGSRGPDNWEDEGSVKLPEGARSVPTIGETARIREERKREREREGERASGDSAGGEQQSGEGAEND